MDGASDEPSGELGERLARYGDAGLLGKAGMLLRGAAPTARDREQLRRAHLGVEGRIAEDVVRAVIESEPIWILLAEKGLPEDLTVQELNAIADSLRGRPTPTSAVTMPVGASIRFTDPDSVDVVRRVIPGELDPADIDAYRYAALTPLAAGDVEPFIVALTSDPLGVNSVAATMLVGATFLRHEQEFDVVAPTDLLDLEPVVQADLAAIVGTQALLRDA